MRSSARAGCDLLLYGTTVLAPVVGATWGALDLTEAVFASDRKPFMTAHARMGDSPGARRWLAEAAHLAQRARRVPQASRAPAMPKAIRRGLSAARMTLPGWRSRCTIRQACHVCLGDRPY
ncbi:hypothetical protein ABZW11_11605 [Nonomuraea sp. NPDC004580]|uniref:hypothetical protein n=1 Tax=Nonomuraea sp. NPDC004580 TaxID=3154552 RepID=UPI0033A8F5B8